VLIDNGYKVKVLNLIDMSKSDGYNPFAYINEEKDVLTMISCFIANTTPKHMKSGEPFWEKSEIALLQALCFYMWNELPEIEQNFDTLLELLRKGEVKEEEEDYISELDLLFEKLSKNNPEHIALKQYRIFKQAAGKTAKSILISVGVRLSPLNIGALATITREDTIRLQNLGEEKTALFVIISDTDSTYNFLASMMYTQLFNTLCNVADNIYQGRLPVHVRLMLDEFANIGQIPDFDKKIATIRSRNISANVILQDITQLKANYKDTWETIISCCDTHLFLGSNDKTTLDFISYNLGKQTIDRKSVV
jgi:type IV secretion system protein VirD4